VAAEGERGDQAEVPAAAAQRPQQVAVGVLAGGHERPVGQDHVGSQQVVRGQAKAPGQVADAAAEREPGHARGRDEAGGGGHAEGHGRMVDISPGASGVGPDRVRCGADGGAAQQRQVDDQRVIPYSEACGVVAAAPDGQLDAVLAAEPDTGDDVGHVPAARDRGRALVGHGVVDDAGRIVARFARRDHLAAQCGR
jgi:hypothetical protein